MGNAGTLTRDRAHCPRSAGAQNAIGSSPGLLPGWSRNSRRHKRTHTRTSQARSPGNMHDKWSLLITMFTGERKTEMETAWWKKTSRDHVAHRLILNLCPAWNLSIFLWEKEKEKNTTPIPRRCCQRQFVGAITNSRKFL